MSTDSSATEVETTSSSSTSTSTGTTTTSEGPPPPGITVTADPDIATSEDGTTASISVVLESQPAAPVTIPVSSSDEGEGSLAVTELVFTADNWDQPQELVVTGEDDGEVDGDQVFTVEFAPAASDDVMYLGLDADDVDVTNIEAYAYIVDDGLENTPLSGGWVCEFANVNDELVLRTIKDDIPRFEFQFGAGGVISHIRDVPEMMVQPTEMLEPGPDNITELVTQWTSYSTSVKFDHPDLVDSDDNFHVNQAGSIENDLSPTINIDINFADCILDIYSVPQNQWRNELNSHIQSKLSQRTRYRVIGNGRLYIRRTILIGDVTLGGEPDSFDLFNLDANHSFDSSAFGHLVYSINESGALEDFEPVGMINANTNADVVDDLGYVAMADANDPMTTLALGVIYGQQEICGGAVGGCADVGSHKLTTREIGGEYVSVIPSLRLQDLEEGDVIEQFLVLAPNLGSDADFGGDLNAIAPIVPAPALVPAGSLVYPPEFDDLIAELAANRDMMGTSTDELGPLSGL